MHRLILSTVLILERTTYNFLLLFLIHSYDTVCVGVDVRGGGEFHIADMRMNNERRLQQNIFFIVT